MVFLPLVLIILAATLSATYRCCSSGKLTIEARSMLIKSHAFTTELLQLSILAAGITVTWESISSKTIMQDIYTISSIDFPIPAWFLATMTVLTYLSALFAVDFIDNRIQLGCWRHPVQMQTLLLTRSLLVPGSLWTIRRRRTAKKHIERPARKKIPKRKRVEPVSTTTPYQYRKRTASEPVTPEMLRRFLREIPVEVSKSGVLIREARGFARRASAAASLVTPTKGRIREDGGEMLVLGTLPVEDRLGKDRRYEVQSKVEVIERVVGKRKRGGSMVLPNAASVTASIRD